MRCDPINRPVLFGGAEMRSQKKGINWQIGYAVFCLVYVAWVVYLSLDNFDMVHGDYRRAGEQLQPPRIRELAIRELVAQCRREEKSSSRLRPTGERASAAAEDPCLSWPAAVVAEREKTVTEHLTITRSRFLRKLVVFYITFGIVFLIMPLVLLYLLLTFTIWIFRNLKFVD